jgi:hypothetical protein
MHLFAQGLRGPRATSWPVYSSRLVTAGRNGDRLIRLTTSRAGIIIGPPTRLGFAALKVCPQSRLQARLALRRSGVLFFA